MSSSIDRRGFVKGLTGVGFAGLSGAALAQGTPPLAGQRSTGAPRRLPPRGEFIVRGGYLLTMDERLGDISDGDVHVRNGQILAVGKNLRVPGATVLDGRTMIVMPGFVDTHWHMWTTYLRCMAGDRMEDGYFPVTTAYGQAMQPEATLARLRSSPAGTPR